MAPNPVKELMEKASRTDRRRQIQIANQVKVIDRLLEGSSYDDEMRLAQEALATAQEALEDALQELETLRRGSGSGA